MRRDEAHGDGADPKVERDLFCPTQDRMIPIEPACCAQRGVSGEGHLFGSKEDADLHSVLAFDLWRAREDEGGFAEIRLAREGLHLVSGETACIAEDGESIAFERVLGEDINLCEVVGAVSRL